MVNKYKFSIDYKLSGGSKDAENENNNDYNTFLLELIKNYKINLLEMKNIETEDTIFTYAIKNKDLENVKILVNYNEGIINSKDSLGKTPLHIAAEIKNNSEIINYLIEKNAEVDALDIYQQTPLYYTLENIENVIVLKNNNANFNIRANDNHTLLHKAVYVGNNDVIDFIFDEITDIDVQDGKGWTPLHIAAEKGNTYIVEKLIEKNANVNIQNENGNTPLHIAISKAVDNNDVIDLIFNKITDLDVQDNKGWTALHIAAEKGNTYIVEKLIEKNANVNIQNENGTTPLNIAILNAVDNNDVIDLIFNEITDLDVQDSNGWTALHNAAEKGNTYIVEKLIEKNANVNIQNENGDTPLHIAVSNNKIDVVKYLVKNKNIQINKQNYDGDTPLHFASYNNNREIIIDLINNGANMDILNLEDPPIKAFPDDQRYITYQ